MNVTSVLSSAELASVTRKSDVRGAWLVLCQWTLTIAIFAGVALWTNALSIVLGTLLLGGRQLGFFVLTHECGHKTLFKSPQLNQWVGEWLLSAADFTNMRAYMREHLAHHRYIGTAQDPDIGNYRDYPISRRRLRRKLTRDITGRTGWRIMAGKMGMLLGLHNLDAENRAAMGRGLVLNAALLGGLVAAGAGALYLMWLAAMIFVQPLVSRVRQISEHAAVPDLESSDPRENTRTVFVNPLVRLLICPHGVNYHVEHHLLASTPIYRLPRLHACLRDAGCYDGVLFSDGYAKMLRQVTRPSPTAA